MSAMRRASSCLFDLAIGDALGAAMEFPTVDEIHQRFPPAGPTEPTGDPARVTDDTQMALAVGTALVEAARPYSAATLEGPLRRAFASRLCSLERQPEERPRAGDDLPHGLRAPRQGTALRSVTRYRLKKVAVTDRGRTPWCHG